MENNLYNFILNENKELIELVDEFFEKEDEFNINIFNDLKAYNKDLVLKKKEENDFLNIFLSNSNFFFWRPFDLNKKVLEIKLNDLIIEINKEINENEIKKQITFTYKDFGLNLDYLIYNLNFEKNKSSLKKDQIRLCNENKKIILEKKSDFWLFKLLNEEKNFNLEYIKELIFEYDIDLYEILTGNIEYKKKLEEFFELEMIKKDSYDLKNFINNEKIFSILNINDFIVKKN